MTFTSRHEQDLSEIKALVRDLSERVEEGLELLGHIKKAQGVDEARPRAVDARQPRSSTETNEGDRMIAFVHIPKTAGGAVSTMFSTAYSRECIFNTGNYVTGPEKSTARVTKEPGGWERWKRRGGRVAIGHTPYGVFRERLPADTRYITFLREPVDRVLSHYYRHVHLPGMTDAELATRGRRGQRARSLEEALVTMRLPQLRNLCTRFLCSHPTLGELPPSALDEAKENLRKFAFVGVQERFEESMVLLQRTLGLGLVPYLNQHVSAPGRRPTVEEISVEERALIEEHNELDIELYAFGLELFQEALAGANGQFEADIERLRGAAQAARDEHDAAKQAAREWLHRELPAGASEPTSSLIGRAEAAGLTRAALTEARKELLVTKKKDRDGEWTFSRDSGASLTALEDAKAWLERELPVGASEPRAALIERSKAAGLSPAALNRARKDLSVLKLRGDDGDWVWSRPQ